VVAKTGQLAVYPAVSPRRVLPRYPQHQVADLLNLHGYAISQFRGHASSSEAVGWDHATDGRPYGGAWNGPISVLTHHPEAATPADGVTFLNCCPAEAVRIRLEAARGKNLEVFSPTIGRQLLELGLIDEIDLHIVPILLGGGIRLYDNPGGAPVRLHRVGGGPDLAVSVRYRPGRNGDPGRRAELPSR
jgi:RibD C-terminal domain